VALALRNCFAVSFGLLHGGLGKLWVMD
jgi:hypothetical protein